MPWLGWYGEVLEFKVFFTLSRRGFTSPFHGTQAWSSDWHSYSLQKDYPSHLVELRSDNLLWPMKSVYKWSMYELDRSRSVSFSSATRLARSRQRTCILGSIHHGDLRGWNKDCGWEINLCCVNHQNLGPMYYWAKPSLKNQHNW